jgi:hypothetical protein
MTYGHTAAARAWALSDSDTAAFTTEGGRGHPWATAVSTATYNPNEQNDPSWLPSVRVALEELRDLRKNWDSYGAEPVSPAMIGAAYELLQQIAPAKVPMPSIVPTSNGSVQIEWHTRGIDLEVRLLSAARISVAFEDATNPGNAWERELTFDVTPLKDLMSDLMSRGP